MFYTSFHKYLCQFLKIKSVQDNLGNTTRGLIFSMPEKKNQKKMPDWLVRLLVFCKRQPVTNIFKACVLPAFPKTRGFHRGRRNKGHPDVIFSERSHSSALVNLFAAIFAIDAERSTQSLAVILASVLKLSRDTKTEEAAPHLSPSRAGRGFIYSGWDLHVVRQNPVASLFPFRAQNLSDRLQSTVLWIEYSLHEIGYPERISLIPGENKL